MKEGCRRHERETGGWLILKPIILCIMHSTRASTVHTHTLPPQADWPHTEWIIPLFHY